MFYCGRRLGVSRIPGSDGRCGPNNGPPCDSCKRLQRRANLAYIEKHQIVDIIFGKPTRRKECKNVQADFQDWSNGSKAEQTYDITHKLTKVRLKAKKHNMSSSFALKLGAKTEFSAGIPFCASTKAEISFETTATVAGGLEWTQSDQESVEKTYKWNFKVPPGVHFEATIVKTTSEVQMPVKYLNKFGKVLEERILEFDCEADVKVDVKERALTSAELKKLRG